MLQNRNNLLEAWIAVMSTGLCLVATAMLVSCVTPERGGQSSHMHRALEFGIVPSAEVAGMPFVFTDLKSTTADYPKLAVLPFKSPVEPAGASVSGCFSTELLRTFKYDLIEPSQTEKILKDLGFSGVTEDSTAIEVGKALGVRGVVVGTVSEYDLQRVGRSTAPCVGINVRMIDTMSGTLVWSVQHARAGESVETLAEHAGNIVREAMAVLSMAWM
jgi:TolB-like protein